MDKKVYAKGEVICREGDFEMWMYEIVSGSVEIYAAYGTPEQKLLRVLEQWDCFGEMGLISAMPRSATAAAGERTEVSIINGENFDEFFRRNPKKVYKIMEQMSARLRSLTADYVDACGTIAEYLKAEETDTPRSTSLLQKMKKYVGVYNQYKKN